MDRSRAYVTGCLLAATLLGAAGCGGGSKPAATGGATTPSSAAATAAPPGADGAGGAASAPSEDVAAGVKEYQAGDLATAKASFEAAAKKNPNDADARYYLGLVADKQGDRAAAEAAYKEALRLRPDHENAPVNLGALYIDSERYDEALLVTRQALQKRPKTAALHVNLAVALANKGDPGSSLRAFEEATRLAPNEAMFQLTYAHWLAIWKKTDDAASKLRAARPMAEGNLGVLAALGHEMRVIGDFEDCVPTYDKAIALKDAAELRTERALCKLGAKDEPGALADLQAAVQKEPNYAPAHFYLGGRLAAAGKWKQVHAEYEAYLRLEPNGPMAKQAQERAKLAREKLGGKK